jgi:hypothetical protein
VREDRLESALLDVLKRLRFNEAEKEYFVIELAALKHNDTRHTKERSRTLSLQLKQTISRLDRLTDAYLDQVLDVETLAQRKATLLVERSSLKDQIAALQNHPANRTERVKEFLELAGNAYVAYKSGSVDEKRSLIGIVTSNREVDGRNIDFTLAAPFHEVANRPENHGGGPSRDRARTRATTNGLVRRIIRHLSEPAAARINQHIQEQRISVDTAGAV